MLNYTQHRINSNWFEHLKLRHVSDKFRNTIMVVKLGSRAKQTTHTTRHKVSVLVVFALFITLLTYLC